MLRGSDLLLPLVGLLLLRGSSSTSAPRPSPGLPPTPLTPGLERQRTRTGGQPLGEWFGTRYAIVLEELPKLGVSDVMLRPVALAILAQWAHETGRGKSEFNFNLGGWRARKSDPFFTARDVQTGPQLFKWTAYPDLPFAIQDQLLRLVERFPSAWRLLVTQPHTSAWIEELGRRGYYTADRAAYARAWAANRAELERLAP